MIVRASFDLLPVDPEVLLRTSQDQRTDLQLMLERYEARTACTQEELRMLHAERSGPHSEVCVVALRQADWKLTVAFCTYQADL